MQVHIRVEGGDPDAVRSLRTWLLEDDDIRAHGRLGTVPGGSDGAMGALDLISLTLGSALSAAQVALAMHGWRKSRAHAPIIFVIRSDGRGGEVPLSDDAEAFAEALRKLEAK